MPGSLARPPSQTHRNKEEEKKLIECSQRSMTEDHGGDMTA
jgi:hypothetical protein